MIEKMYEVAGHAFCLSMPEDSDIWAKLGNYAPFELLHTAGLGKSAVFRCELCDELPSGNPQLYYRDNPADADSPCIDIYRQADGLLFEMHPARRSSLVFRLWTTSDFTSGFLQKWSGGNVGRFPVDNALMLMYAMRTTGMDTLEMHASVTMKDGRGYLFLGESGTGKSTHSRMWLENIPGSRLLNDDNPIIRVGEDGTVRVYGSPWSGKTSCYLNDSCPVGGFVRIRQYPSNEISRLSVLESYSELLSSCSGMKMNDSMVDAMHSTFEKVLGAVPFWLMKCLPDGDAARVCYEKVKYGDSDSAE